jgi:hypothetical protein
MGTTGFDVTKFLAKLCDGRLWHPPQDQLSCKHENARAESGVRTVKRMPMDIVKKYWTEPWCQELCFC